MSRVAEPFTFTRVLPYRTSPPGGVIIAMNKIFNDLQKRRKSLHYSYVHVFKKQACYTVVRIYSVSL